jgi:hypothetical protein
MIYSIDLLMQLLSCFGGAIQLQEFPRLAIIRPFHGHVDPAGYWNSLLPGARETS